jgi:hypothetical protein
LPHSNFHPELEIFDDGNVIKIGGPLEKAEKDTVNVVVTAFVSQAPDHRATPPETQQGPTGTNSVKLEHAELVIEDGEWECTAEVEGGSFREGWAFASAEQAEKAENGAIERYTWSQWVWLRHP